MTTPPAADPGTVLRDATAAMRQGNLPGAALSLAIAEAASTRSPGMVSDVSVADSIIIVAASGPTISLRDGPNTA